MTSPVIPKSRPRSARTRVTEATKTRIGNRVKKSLNSDTRHKMS